MAKKARQPTEGTALSRRLDAAMAPLGYTNERWAELLGVTAGNISHWRTGRHAPDVPTIARIAEIAQASDYYLLTGKPDPRTVMARLQAARQRFAEAVAAGEDAATAWERILGNEDVLSAKERGALSSETNDLRGYLATVDGTEWFALTEEQRHLVRELMRLFGRYGPPPDPDTSRDSALAPEKTSE